MKYKINLRLILIAGIAIIATVIGVTYIYYAQFKIQVKDDLRVSAKLLKDTKYFESAGNHIEDADFTFDMDELRITWIDMDGTVLYDNDMNAASLENHANRPEIKKAIEDGEGEIIRKSDTMNMNTFYYAVRLGNGTVLRVAREAKSIEATFFAAIPTILVITLLILVLCIALSHMLTRQLLVPIERMARNIEDVKEEPPYKELVPFANMIRKQHENILASAKMRQDFTANVSHELKTPLTAISGYAELIENGMVDQEKTVEFSGEIRRNSERLLSLINDIIELSELDHAANAPVFTDLELNEIVADELESLRVNASKRNVTLHYDGEECRIRGNNNMLRELIDNLVQNAVRYNNEGGNVWVTVADDTYGRYLEVRDDGIGISKEDQERVFERFYRADKSRSKETGGTGLGLAIVKHIVELHSARIELESELNKGTTVRIMF